MERRVVTIKGIQTLITMSGEGTPLLCLHGWEATHESFTELREAMKNDSVQIIAPDLPGFGETHDPPHGWTVDEYADFVEELVGQLGLKNVLLLGHSFGGRIAIKLAARQSEKCHGERRRTMTSTSLVSARDDKNNLWIAHLYLCASAGIRRPRHWKRTMGVKLAEWGSEIFSLPGLLCMKTRAKAILYKVLRVHDYEKARGVNRETMVKVINEDLTEILEKIEVPTDIFWGTKDKMTPYRDGQIMNKKIVHSTLHTFPGIRHRVHRHQAEEIARVIRNQ